MGRNRDYYDDHGYENAQDSYPEDYPLEHPAEDSELDRDDYNPYDLGDDEELIDGVGFADPGGRSALRAETPNNPRDQPCPTCRRKNVLTRIDVQRGYQCDRCADRAEGRMGGDY